MRVGPGVMPDFSGFDDSEVADVTAWVTQVGQEPDDRGGLGIGHVGPLAEGFVIWLVIAIGVVGTLRWIGDTTADRITAEGDEAVLEAGAEEDETESLPTRVGTWLVVLAASGAEVARWLKRRRRS